MSDMQNMIDSFVGRTVTSVNVFTNAYGDERSFEMTFDDGSTMDVSSRGFSDCSSVVTVDVFNDR